MADLTLTSTNPSEYDFTLNTYDGSGNLTERKAYIYWSDSNISAATHNAGTVTVTTATPHNIILAWNNAVTYGLGVKVSYGNRIYRSLTGTGNLNKNPQNEATYWEELKSWDVLSGWNVVEIHGVAGMTDLNDIFTVQTTASTTTFTVTLTTAQVYTSGGTARGGKFQFKGIYRYDSSGNFVDQVISYEDD